MWKGGSYDDIMAHIVEKHGASRAHEHEPHDRPILVTDKGADAPDHGYLAVKTLSDGKKYLCCITVHDDVMFYTMMALWDNRTNASRYCIVLKGEDPLITFHFSCVEDARDASIAESDGLPRGISLTRRARKMVLKYLPPYALPMIDVHFLIRKP
jgi:hypothetical protein